MTEQQKKAKELVENYMPLADGVDRQEDHDQIEEHIENAKQCAIICVDEILKIAVDISDDITWTKGFWHQVKQEIINYKN